MTSQESKKIKDVLICVPIWGHSYMKKFLKYTLPSYFAENNVPEISKSYKVKIIFLTTEKDFKIILKNSSVSTFDENIEVKFLDISDLIVNAQYTFTLTMAYARAINSIEDHKIGNTLVYFANSDFVFSNGSLNNIAKAAENGAQAIYGSSLRAIDSKSELALAKLVSKSDFSSRHLVDIALTNPHPTVTAMTINNGYCYYQNVRQLFYKVDSKTLLARNFLLCIVGLVPQRKLSCVNSYHDYSFVPELTNENCRVVLNDSDDYFALELQNELSERQFIKLGQLLPEQIAKSIDRWAMAEHRWASNSETIIHSDSLPPDIALSQMEFNLKYNEICHYLKSNPRTHVNHYHWTSGALFWQAKASLLFGKFVKLGNLNPPVFPINLFFIVNSIYKYPISSLREIRRILERISGLHALKSNLKSFASVVYSKTFYSFEIQDLQVKKLPYSGKFLLRIPDKSTSYIFVLKNHDFHEVKKFLKSDKKLDSIKLIYARTGSHRDDDSKVITFLNEMTNDPVWNISYIEKGSYRIAKLRDFANDIICRILRRKHLKTLWLSLLFIPLFLIFLLTWASLGFTLVRISKFRRGSCVQLILHK